MKQHKERSVRYIYTPGKPTCYFKTKKKKEILEIKKSSKTTKHRIGALTFRLLLTRHNSRFRNHFLWFRLSRTEQLGNRLWHDTSDENKEGLERMEAIDVISIKIIPRRTCKKTTWIVDGDTERRRMLTVETAIAAPHFSQQHKMVRGQGL